MCMYSYDGMGGYALSSSIPQKMYWVRVEILLNAYPAASSGSGKIVSDAITGLSDRVELAS